MFRLFIWRGIEEISGVGTGALPEPPAAAVIVIRAALEGHIHYRAAIVPELCRKTVVLDFEFLDHLNRGLVIHVTGRALPLFRCADQSAINSDLRRGVSLTVGNKVCAGGIVVIRSRSGGFRNPTRKKREPEEIAAGKWNFVYG